MKTCAHCKEEKPLTAFYLRSDGRGARALCKVCHVAETTKNLRAGGKMRAYKLSERYNLPVFDYESLLVAQGNRCATCRSEFKTVPCVDHDHATGRVRGLLCKRCNTALGLVHDDVPLLLELIDYLDANGHGAIRRQVA